MLKQSPLIEFHKSNGAVFAESGGWLLPSHFGNFASEYEAVRTGVGLMDLSHRALLEFTGADRFSYLQGMVSNDLRDLAPGKGLYATILNQQGKVLGDARVLGTDESFLLDLWEPIKDKIVEHLNRYLVADEVEIIDRTDQYGVISAQGPRSPAFVTQIIEPAVLPQQPLDHLLVRIDGADVRVVRSTHTPEEGFDFVIPTVNLVRVVHRLAEIGRTVSAKWVGQEAQELLRIEAGIPRYGVDFTEDNLLLETGLDHAVSFTKGCYLGQEVIERIHSRGHVNKKLAGLYLDGRQSARAGDFIFAADREVGAVTSSVYSPALQRAIALGYVHRDFWASGTRLSVKHDGVSIPAEVAALPFVGAGAGVVSSP